MSTVTFYVFKEHTLGYVEGNTDKEILRLWILAVDYMKGGEPLLLGNEVLAARKDLRLATLADFSLFRVNSKGYQENPRYVFNRETR